LPSKPQALGAASVPPANFGVNRGRHQRERGKPLGPEKQPSFKNQVSICIEREVT
jgi:hypothetical protein